LITLFYSQVNAELSIVFTVGGRVDQRSAENQWRSAFGTLYAYVALSSGHFTRLFQRGVDAANVSERWAKTGGPAVRTYRKIARLLTVVFCASLVTTSANAAPILNGSFEDGGFVANAAQGTMSLGLGSTTITNWTVVVDGIAWIESPNPWSLSAQHGNRFLDLTLFQAGSPFGGVTQTIATDVGSDYLLSFYLGSLTAIWGGPPVSILATAGSTTQTCTDDTTSTVSTWTLCTVPFTALLANTQITLVGSAGFHYIGLDNVSVELVDGNGSPVSEPASILLLGAGVAGLLAALRRTRAVALRSPRRAAGRLKEVPHVRPSVD
jgi:hypothetical protein